MLLNLISFLRSVAGLAAQMNLDFIFPAWTVSADLAYISVSLVSSTFETDKDKTVVMTAGTFQLDIYAETYKKANDIAFLIKTAINGYATLNDHSFYIEDERDVGEEEAKKFRRSLDIAVELQSL